MSDLIERLRKRMYPYHFANAVAAGGGANLCNAVSAIVYPAEATTFTIGGPDKDVQDAIAEIERLSAYAGVLRQKLDLALLALRNIGGFDQYEPAGPAASCARSTVSVIEAGLPAAEGEGRK